MGSDKGPQKTGTAAKRELRGGLQVALDEARQPPTAGDLAALDEQLRVESEQGLPPPGGYVPAGKRYDGKPAPKPQ